MRKLLLGLLLVPGLVMANPINTKLRQITEQLRVQMGVSQEVTLVIDGSGGVAMTDGDREIWISKPGLLRASGLDYNIIAAVIAHEMAHIKNNDREVGSPGLLQRQELKADKDGVRAATQIGYNGMAVCKFFKAYLSHYGNPPPGSSHPTWQTRMQNIGCR